jgi:hypothetical protein
MKLATFNPLPIFPDHGSVTLITDILNVTKSLSVTQKGTIYVVKPLLRYIYRLKN